MVDRIRNQKIDDETLERARTKVLTTEATGRQSNSQRATQAVLDELYGLGFKNNQRFIERVRSVSAEDVQRVARKYLKNPMAVILTNERIPAEKLPALR